MSKSVRFLLISLIALFIFGCILEQKTALRAEAMQITQNGNEILLAVNLSGNDWPEQAMARLLLLDEKGNALYDKEFELKKEDFKIDKGRLEKYLRLESDRKFSYAEFRLELPSQAFKEEIGSLPKGAVELKIETLEQETQYAIIIEFTVNGKKEKANGTMKIKVLDAEGELYYEEKKITERDFDGDCATVLLPYKKVPKSFYGKGNLLIGFNGMEKRLEISLRRYSEKEKLALQETYFEENAARVNAATEYVGFGFDVTTAGYYDNYNYETGSKARLVRFDVSMRNMLSRPQYLIRSDFYIKDGDGNFYPVYGKISTGFGPLLKPNERTNASFYFNILAEKNYYSFYYGDRKLAEFNAKVD